MIYGNSIDKFEVIGGSLFRKDAINHEKQYCRFVGRTVAEGCGDWCSAFQRYKDGEFSELHLCCTSPPTVIRIKEFS